MGSLPLTTLFACLRYASYSTPRCTREDGLRRRGAAHLAASSEHSSKADLTLLPIFFVPREKAALRIVHSSRLCIFRQS